MVKQETINDNYIRVFSDQPQKKVHILATNIDKSMLILPKKNDYEFEEWDIDIERDADIYAETDEKDEVVDGN